VENHTHPQAIREASNECNSLRKIREYMPNYIMLVSRPPHRSAKGHAPINLDGHPYCSTWWNSPATVEHLEPKIVIAFRVLDEHAKTIVELGYAAHAVTLVANGTVGFPIACGC
jgi:hypothetical protein